MNKLTDAYVFVAVRLYMLGVLLLLVLDNLSRNKKISDIALLNRTQLASSKRKGYKKYNIFHIITLQRCYRGYIARKNLKTELLALFEHHPSEVDSIELMLRRGIRILREGFIECDLFLAGHSSNMLVCIEKCRDSSICTEINMRDIAAINICSEGKYAHTGIIVTYCGAHNGSILLTCETPSISHDLVHALRLVVERGLTARDLEARGRVSWLLLPLKSLHQQEVSASEFLEARSCLLGTPLAVNLYADPKGGRPQIPSILASCYSKNAGLFVPGTSPRHQYYGKGQITAVQPNKQNIVDERSICLMVEEYTLNTFLLSRTVIPFHEIVEVRSGLDSYHTRTLQGVDAGRVVTLFTNDMSLALALDSANQQRTFLNCSRKISTYCREVARIG